MRARSHGGGIPGGRVVLQREARGRRGHRRRAPGGRTAGGTATHRRGVPEHEELSAQELRYRDQGSGKDRERGSERARGRFRNEAQRVSEGGGSGFGCEPWCAARWRSRAAGYVDRHRFKRSLWPAHLPCDGLRTNCAGRLRRRAKLCQDCHLQRKVRGVAFYVIVAAADSTSCQTSFRQSRCAELGGRECFRLAPGRHGGVPATARLRERRERFCLRFAGTRRTGAVRRRSENLLCILRS